MGKQISRTEAAMMMAKQGSVQKDENGWSERERAEGLLYYFRNYWRRLNRTSQRTSGAAGQKRASIRMRNIAKHCRSSHKAGGSSKYDYNRRGIQRGYL